ncbi:MAG: hypothetical protein JW795_15630, partial [Chitinivibrionales bacterium]|nr:hypothetical protein [Chitinivibrionales bacterium]
IRLHIDLIVFRCIVSHPQKGKKMYFKPCRGVIVAVLFSMVYCVNEPVLPLHPVLRLSFAQRQITLTTTTAEQHSVYKIVDDACTLSVAYRLTIDGIDTLITNHVVIKNDSLQSGTFYGRGMVSDTVLPDPVLAHTRTLISACVTDETKHEACASVVLNETKPVEP